MAQEQNDDVEQYWLSRTEAFNPPVGRADYPHDDLMRSYGQAAAALQFYHKAKIICLLYMESHPKGEGHGEKIIDLIKQLCIDFGYVLDGNANCYDPFNRDFEPTERDLLKLRLWYERRGIKVEQDYNKLKFPV